MTAATPILEVRDVQVEYRGDKGERLHAVRGVSFALGAGEVLGLVGESGCGKSSLARAILQLPTPREGSVTFRGVELTRLAGRKLRETRARLPLVMQNPSGSLNPRRTVGSLIAQPLVLQGMPRVERRARTRELLELVGLDPAVESRRPRQLSGGQCQRVNIARALACNPSIMLCDEVVSALDVSAQGRIVNLLRDTKNEFGFAMLFISHNLAVVKRISTTVAVMYLGKIVEIGSVAEIYERPRHPYTVKLLESVLEPIVGQPLPTTTKRQSDAAAGLRLTAGCRFRDRCPRAQELCAVEEPELAETEDGALVACHFPVVE